MENTTTVKPPTPYKIVGTEAMPEAQGGPFPTALTQAIHMLQPGQAFFVPLGGQKNLGGLQSGLTSTCYRLGHNKGDVRTRQDKAANGVWVYRLAEEAAE